MSITVTLSVFGDYKKTISVNEEPHSEADLLKYPEYTKYYYSVGLGAPVCAKVTVSEGFLKNRNYQFDFTIKGNYMTLDAVTKVLDDYKGVSKCEYYNVTAERAQQYIISFDSNAKAYEMYQRLENRSNVGAYHGYDDDIKKYVVQIEYHPV